MLSQKTRYAIRALQHLADRYGEGLVQLSEIAERQNIPPKFLTVILSELARYGIVASSRGRDGGYALALAPVDISYGDLVRVLRGSLALVPCASRYAHEKCRNCVAEKDCRTRALMLMVRDQTAELLDSISLADSFDLGADVTRASGGGAPLPSADSSKSGTLARRKKRSTDGKNDLSRPPASPA